jgi:hypothetical protein
MRWKINSTSKSIKILLDSEETYREKLVTLRESYYPSNTGTQTDESETISEESSGQDQEPVTGLMESYIQTMNRVTKK